MGFVTQLSYCLAFYLFFACKFFSFLFFLLQLNMIKFYFKILLGLVGVMLSATVGGSAECEADPIVVRLVSFAK